jgi:ribose 5-phosphate isomerase A
VTRRAETRSSTAGLRSRRHGRIVPTRIERGGRVADMRPIRLFGRLLNRGVPYAAARCYLLRRPAAGSRGPTGRSRLTRLDGSEALKRAAAERAAEWIRDGMTLGLGTGSTVRHLLDVIAERRAAGDWHAVVGIPTSEDTTARARRLGIPLATLAERPRVDLTIDGADEVDPLLRLIKGLGGALLREKIVAAASSALVIVADESKVVERLGTRAPLPVEVERFGEAIQPDFIRRLGADPVLRRGDDGTPVVTDGGNHVFDCRFAEGIEDPEGLERDLALRPGVLECGLFLGMATAAVIAGADGVRVMEAAS